MKPLESYWRILITAKFLNEEEGGITFPLVEIQKPDLVMPLNEYRCIYAYQDTLYTIILFKKNGDHLDQEACIQLATKEFSILKSLFD